MNNDIILTGTSGYIGSHLSEYLTSIGVNTYHLTRINSQKNSSEDHVISLHDFAERREDVIAKIKGLNDPILINLAGYYIPSHSCEDISKLVSGNIEYVTEIYDLMVESSVDKVIHVGTSWEYNEFGYHNTPNLYVATKICGEVIAKYYQQSAGLKMIDIKLLDTFGGTDSRKKLMPLIKEAYLQQTELKLRSSSQLINICHISDIVELFYQSCLRLTKKISPEYELFFARNKKNYTVGQLIHVIKSDLSLDLDVHFDSLDQDLSRPTYWANCPTPNYWAAKEDLNPLIADYLLSK